jgi:hypothetical protein
MWTDMADDPEVSPDPAGGAAARRPSAAAAAASRARRIGGRTGAAPAAHLGADAGTATTKPGTPPARISPSSESGFDDPALEPAAGPVRVSKAAPNLRPDLPPAPAGAAASVPAWLRWAPAGFLSAAAVAMAIVLVVTSHGVWWGKQSGTAIRDQVLAAAKACVAKTNTYRYTSIDAYERAGLTCATGDFTSQFRDAVEKLVKKNAPTLKSVQSTQINTAAIESVTRGGHWSVLIFGQIKVTNTNYPNGRTDPFGAVVQMTKVHGTWLISGLKTVSSPVQNGS